MADLVLYRGDGACSFVPHALLNELGIPYTDVVLEFKDGVFVSKDGSFSIEEYRRIHPSGYVPALKVDGQIITELPAVLTYICELAPERLLLGSHAMERAKIYEWLVWLSGTLHGVGYASFWRPKRFSDDNTPNIYKAISEKGRRTVMECYSTIEGKLDSHHAVGNRFTPVDLALHTFYRWGALKLGFDSTEFFKHFPKLAALAQEVEAMKSVQETLKQENLERLFRL